MIENIDLVIANGFIIDKTADRFSLDPLQRQNYALRAKNDYRVIDRSNFQPNEVLLSAKGPAVWTTSQLLSRTECQQWIQRAENINFDEGDFIFKTGKNGYERMETGGRRSSATMVMNDQTFASEMVAKLKGHIPEILGDKRKFTGIRESFLISKYQPGQYFAPHYDGNTSAIVGDGVQSQSEFTVVLYLSEDFTGGATHYLPGPQSEVQNPIAVQPMVGHAIIHRAVTILHAGGEVLSGTK